MYQLSGAVPRQSGDAQPASRQVRRRTGLRALGPRAEWQVWSKRGHKPPVRSTVTGRPVSTQVGHKPAQEVIREADVQNRPTPTATRPWTNPLAREGCPRRGNGLVRRPL
jgi:hypothetical protein